MNNIHVTNIRRKMTQDPTFGQSQIHLIHQRTSSDPQLSQLEYLSSSYNQSNQVSLNLSSEV